MRDDITKRIISNDQTGSSWHFKRFKRLTVIVISSDNSVNILFFLENAISLQQSMFDRYCS